MIALKLCKSDLAEPFCSATTNSLGFSLSQRERAGVRESYPIKDVSPFLLNLLTSGSRLLSNLKFLQPFTGVYSLLQPFTGFGPPGGAGTSVRQNQTPLCCLIFPVTAIH